MRLRKSLAIGVLGLGVVAAEGAQGEGSTSLAPREAGARYGQSLGAIEICYGSKITEKGKALEKDFSGNDLEAFKLSAAKTYEAWLKVKDCRKQFDPNQCKIIMDKSCLAAEAEIGSAGTALPGLVEFIKH